MDMIKFLFMVIIPLTLYISPTIADDDHQNVIKIDSQLDLITQQYQEDVNGTNGIPRKRNLRHVCQKKMVKLKPRPFSRYGPPRYPSISQFKRPSPQVPNEHLNSWSHHPNDGTPEKIQGLNNNYNQEQYSPLRLDVPSQDFKHHDPIASQNNEPFNHNVANYLPPKNQQLPGFTSFHLFQNQQPTHLPTDHKNPGDYKISDATFFILKNAKAISKLYETPVMNLNYPPFGTTGDESGKDKFNAQQSIKIMKQLQSKCNKLNRDTLKSVESTPDVPIPATISTSHVHQGTTVYPYPQYNGLFPLFGTTFNLANNIPSYEVSAGSSSIYPTPVSGNSSPTHSGLPFSGIAAGRGDITPGTYSHVPVLSVIPAVTPIQNYPAFPGDYIRN